MRTMWVLLLGLLAGACTGIPVGHQVVKSFQLDRYLGTWYEIARLDHGFETGLNHVTATYSLRPDGGVKVINRGQEASGSWREAEGKAYFIGATDEGRFKVSFFGPFYGSYNILALDPDYQLALVSSYNLDYLWILSRTPKPAKEQVAALVQQAHSLGFATDKLIWVEQ